MRPARVLVTSSHALPHIGGVEVLVEQELQALADAGCQVTLVTSDLSGNGNQPRPREGVGIVRVPSSSYLERKFGLYCPLFSPRLLPILWREAGRCDVVHGHGYLALNTVLAMVIGRLRGRKCILTEHNGIQPRKTWFATLAARILVETLGRTAVRLAGDCVTYNSRVMKTLRRLGGRRKPLHFVPYPINTKLFRPPTGEERQRARASLGWTDGRPRVLCVGRLVAEKGTPLLLRAVDPARYDLVFCGAGDVTLLGGLPRPGVEYLLPRPQSELVQAYHAADLFILPSYVEGFPLAAREAMACGLPTILGYDEGYEPYRDLPLLSFCELTPESVAAAIHAALSPPAVTRPASVGASALDDPHQWVRAVYGAELTREGARHASS